MKQNKIIWLICCLCLFSTFAVGAQGIITGPKKTQQTTKSNDTSKKSNKNSKTTNENTTSNQTVSREKISTIITSYPSGATIYINDVFVGYTPYTYKIQHPEYIIIRCSKSGFSSQKRYVYVDRDQHLNFELDVPIVRR